MELLVQSKLPPELVRLASDTKLISLSRFPVSIDPINLLTQTRQLSEHLTEIFDCIALKTRLSFWTWLSIVTKTGN